MFTNFISKIKSFFFKTFKINYIFFSFFLLLISFFSSFKTNALFTFYSTLQASLLTIFFIFLYYNLKFKFLKNLLIITIFSTTFLYTANFFLIGLMDTNVLFALCVFFSGGLENIGKAFRALNLNFVVILIGSLLITLLPLIGLLFFNLSNRFCQKKPLILKQKHLFFVLIATIFLIPTTDLICRYKEINYISKNHYKLPLFSNTIPTKKHTVLLSNDLKNLRNENEILKDLNSKNLQLNNKPNIFIFVIETLRKDYITKDIAPNIFDFKEKNIDTITSFSSANATPISWYSIFHSNYPFFWSKANKTLAHGSIPLNILKKSGYKINVFNSAEISYFNMDKLLFGKNNHLVDNFNDFFTCRGSPSEKDAINIDSLKKEIKKDTSKNANVFIIFLDSTHSEYYWSKDFKPKFLPISKSINYISLFCNRNSVDLVKNRYKNAINYIDHLFADFLTALKNNNLYDDAIIVLTGDHGEELFEENSIFHGSHLNEYQTRVPIIFKIQNNNEKWLKPMSHIDIFPTILNILHPNENFDKYFDGKSIFLKDFSSPILLVNQNGAQTPNEFLFIKDQTKIHGKFLNKPKPSFDIHKTQNISEKNIEEEINKAFKPLIK